MTHCVGWLVGLVGWPGCCGLGPFIVVAVGDGWREMVGPFIGGGWAYSPYFVRNE